MSDTKTCTSEQKQGEGASAASSETKDSGAKSGGSSLDDLFSTLRQQINTSNWLDENTAEKWVKENPELAKDFAEAAKKS